MQASELAKALNARRCGRGKWMAKCPVHRDRNPSLSIVEGKDRVHVHCFAGCSSDDVMATLGLTWKAMLYEDETLTPEQKKMWAKKKEVERQRNNLRRFDDVREMLK